MAVPLDVANADFVDLQHAVALEDGGKALLSTSDGGTHWTRVPLQIPFTRVMSIDFVSPMVGWMLATSPPSTVVGEGQLPQKGDAFALLRTTDRGRTWHEIARSVV